MSNANLNEAITNKAAQIAAQHDYDTDAVYDALVECGTIPPHDEDSPEGEAYYGWVESGVEEADWLDAAEQPTQQEGK